MSSTLLGGPTHDLSDGAMRLIKIITLIFYTLDEQN